VKKRYLITSALPYANGPLHIGHIAGAYLPADIFVRYLRLKEVDVVYVCGSDEHGAAITLRAKKEGLQPQEIIDKYHHLIKKTFEEFGMDFDIYHRTSDPLHHKTAQDVFTDLHSKGVFTEKRTEQYFDLANHQFLADRYIAGTCPKCGYENAYGDQCENCGSALSPSELINPKSTLSGETPILKETSHWYLPMQNHEEWLKAWINQGVLNGKVLHDPSAWKNQVIGQCNSWIEGGLRERAMTRDLDWGVKVPLPNSEGKVLYVWMDAPIGYISATRAWAQEQHKDWKTYWQDEDTALIHFIGKDNIVFHAIIFPIILKELGTYVLPENVPANAFLNLEGNKLSTSRNWAVWLHEYLADFPGKQDELRYVLTAISPESRDSEFTWKEYQERINHELVAIYGNFVNRAMVLTHTYFDGEVPDLDFLNAEDQKTMDEMSKYPDRVGALIMAYRFREAQAEMMNLARLGNKYLAENEPWKKIKTDPQRVKTIMTVSLHITAYLAMISEPFLPFSAQKLKDMLRLPDLRWNNAESFAFEKGHHLQPSQLLFEKVEDKVVDAQVEKLKSSQKTQEVLIPVKDPISFDDFTKLDIRTATIVEAFKIPKTKNLLQLKLNTGIDERTVVSGISGHYSAEEAVGKSVLVLLNLEPRKIRGVQSEGMILMAENSAGELSMVQAEKEMENGSIVR
jgi:methionyl-tRNA synthetase